MNFINFVIVKYNRPYYRPVVKVSMGDRKVSLGKPDDDGLPMSLEEAQALAKMLYFKGYDALVWSRGKDEK